MNSVDDQYEQYKTSIGEHGSRSRYERYKKIQKWISKGMRKLVNKDWLKSKC